MGGENGSRAKAGSGAAYDVAAGRHAGDVFDARRSLIEPVFQNGGARWREERISENLQSLGRLER